MPNTATKSLAETEARLRASFKDMPRKPAKRAPARPATARKSATGNAA